MAGLVPAIHVFLAGSSKDVEAPGTGPGMMGAMKTPDFADCFASDSQKMARLFPFDDVSQDDIGQLDDKLPKPGILLDERDTLDVVLIPGCILTHG